MKILRTRVTDVVDVSPGIRRVWISHPELPQYPRYADYSIKLIVPLCNSDLLREGELDAQYRMTLLSSNTAVLRTYTVAELHTGHYALDCALHDDPGIGTRWFINAAVDKEAWVIVPSEGEPIWAPFLEVPRPAKLIAAVDDTATMALRTIMKEADYPVEAIACVKGDLASGYLDDSRTSFIRHSGCIRDFIQPTQEALIALLDRSCSHNVDVAISSEVLENPETIGNYLWHVGKQASDTHIFIAGESGFVKALRRAVLASGHVEKEQVSFMGYWKLGVAS